MSSLWTPGGERPVPRPGETAPSNDPDPRLVGGGRDGGGRGGGGPEPEPELTEAEMRQQMEELREQLSHTPAEVVVANHAYGLFELAALHLSLDQPQLDQARLAIDALACLVEGMGDRLGEPAVELSTALAQLRLAFVQVQAALQGEAGRTGAEG